MPKAKPLHDENSFLSSVDEREGCMFLLIPVSFWNTLILQGRIEGRQPGEVLDSALRLYIEKNGSEEIKKMLDDFATELQK